MRDMKILVTTDGSPRSLEIVPHAAKLAAALGAEIVLTRVLDPRVDAASEVAPKLEDAVGRVEAQWRSAMEKALADAGVPGSVAIPHREWGKEVAEAIHLEADRQRAVAVAISSRGGGAIRHALLGSVAMGVIQRADLPVLTLGRSHPVSKTSGPYHLVILSDGSPDSRSIFAGLAKLLVPGKVKVTLLEVVVMKAQEREEEARERARPALEALLPRLPAGVEAGVHIDAVVPNTNIANAIAQVAAEIGADAIASATHGHSARRHLVAGSTALGVVEKAGVPVILVKSSAID